MSCFIGIDLGSTTTKAVVLDEDQNILGRGITNSRSNYDTAAAIAKQEALVNARFHLFRQALGSTSALNGDARRLPGPARARLPPRAVPGAARRPRGHLPARASTARSSATPARRVGDALAEVFRRLPPRRAALFAPGAKRKSDFFRDIAGSQYLAIGEAVAKEAGVRFDLLLDVFDRAIIEVENRVYGDSIKRHLLARARADLRRAAGDRRPPQPGRGADQGHPRPGDGGDLRRRHRLRPRAPAVLEGADPLGDPLPRPRART